MKKSTLLTLAAALLAGAPVSTTFAVVTPLDTFDIEVDAINASADYSAEAVPTQSATFGTTQTFPGAGFTGYAVTVSSSEAIGATTTTDTITISTPDNFIPAGNTFINGDAITGIEFDIGLIRKGAGDPLNYVTPLSYSTTTLSDLFNFSADSPSEMSGAPSLTLYDGGFELQSVSYYDPRDGSLVSADAINSYTLTISYPTIPEPSAYVQAGLGVLSLGTVLWLRNRRRAGLLL